MQQDYYNKIKSFINENNFNNSLILIWEGIPNIELCFKINIKFNKLNIYWLFIVDISLFDENCIYFINKYFKYTFNFIPTLNPLGITILNIGENITFWILNKDYQNTWYEYVQGFAYLFVNFQELQKNNKILKPWFQRQFTHQKIDEAIVIGAGISGACTARYLANKGVKVKVLEQDKIASKASGNKQSILYAKISAHNTLQTELLLQSYSFTLQNLQLLLPDKKFWDDCGVLHLDFDLAEKKRNLNLSKANLRLYKYLNVSEASKISGIDLNVGGLFWLYGGWLNPKALILELLNHKLISVQENCNVNWIKYTNNSYWDLSIDNNKIINCKNLVLCVGGQSNEFYSLTGLRFNLIRGQTTDIRSNKYSQKLKIVLSGKGYIPPSFKGSHCIGSTFKPNNKNQEFNIQDNEENLDKLKDIDIKLFESFINKGINYNNILDSNTGLRCDSYNHLPVVGMVGDYIKMRQIYAKLKLDKNYRLNIDCPYMPGLYINTSHGSRGMLTAMMSSEYLVSEMLNLPSPVNFNLRSNLSPNKIIINDIVRNT